MYNVTLNTWVQILTCIAITLNTVAYIYFSTRTASRAPASSRMTQYYGEPCTLST